MDFNTGLFDHHVPLPVSTQHQALNRYNHPIHVCLSNSIQQVRFYISFCLVYSCHYLYSHLQTGAVHEEFYKDCDLIIGGEVNVWGRRVILADCDDFTKHYYRAKYGIGTVNTNEVLLISLFQYY